VVDANPAVHTRIGLIIPSSNQLTEPQFQRYAPPGVQAHVTRLRMTGPHHVPLLELLPRVAEAARLLDDAGCDVVVFHCTASSMSAGLAAEARVVETIQEATGRRATTTASALLAALRALEARRLVLVTPYPAESNAHEREFLAEAGIEVVRDRALDLPRTGGGYAAPPPSFWLEVTLAEADPRADAYLLSCTTIQSIEVVEELEARLARPVVTSNQATLWYCLRACGRADAVPGLGRLFGRALPADFAPAAARPSPVA
jgi:maleate isomerase